MYLKTVEIIGFKSFADKTTIEFDNGFTAIVGPNGSGKSNITEAIKWVLGEQSAKSLRGAKMSDVIFAGAVDRRKGQYAQVTLIFDNKDRSLDFDSDEVSLTRRYTAAGDSEYMINRRPCRLKDITEMMMDTGIGRDSFSIISQGKVEQIFTQKAEDRRGIIEEAAGVMKYKSRKHEAERKLKHTEENLHRIYDILSEIADRIEPLEIQKDKAIHYKQSKKALSEIEIALTTVQIETLNEQWQVAKNDLASYVSDIDRRRQTLNETQTALSKYRTEASEADEKVNDLQSTYVDLVKNAEQLQAKIQVHHQQVLYKQNNQASQEDTLDDLKASVKAFQADIIQLKAKMSDMAKEIASQTEKRDEIAQSVNDLSSGGEDVVQARRTEYIEALQEQSNLKNQISQLEQEMANEAVNAEKDQSDRAEKETQIASLEEQLAKIQVEKETLAKQIEDLLSQYQQQSQLVKDQQDASYKNNQLMNQANQQLMQARARKDSLEDLERDHAGFYQGVKAALDLSKQISGVHGAVAQLIRVPDVYTGAVETALGGAMQNIVTENGKVASQLIGELKRQRAGRATFLPLDVIRGRSIGQSDLNKVQRLPGFIGVMADLVDFDQQYDQIVRSLMGNVIVADNLENARTISKSLNSRYRIVTLESDVINAGGSMTGGATKRQNNAGLLSRKTDIDSLTLQIDQLAKTVEQYEADMKEASDQAEQLNEDLQEIKGQGDEARFHERTVTSQIDQLSSQISELKESLEKGGDSQKRLAQIKASKEKSLKALRDDLKAVDDQVIHLKDAIDSLSLSASEKAQKREQLQGQLQSAETDLAVLKSKHEQVKDNLASREQELTDKKAQVDQVEESLRMMTEAILSNSETSNSLEKDYQAAVKAQKDCEADLNAVRKVRNDAQKQADKLDQEVKEMNNHLQSLLEKQAKIEASISRHEVSIDNHLNHLREEYGLTFERARETSQLEMSMESASLKVRDLKKEIENIEPVNLAAIDEFEEVNERFIFMQKQRDDVLEAKAKLYQTISEMDEEVSERFEVTFNNIRDSFEAIFPKLFGGGQASLKLTDPSNLLESGIEIEAQPPGKRLQHLSLLSGGEKALTAIALLFAILDVKTVPFSILDEVEAALDEANVARYGKFLREFADKTQFIVITHRKGTMEAANILYGVTMQESGVSKLAAVRLEDFDEELLENA